MDRDKYPFAIEMIDDSFVYNILRVLANTFCPDIKAYVIKILNYIYQAISQDFLAVKKIYEAIKD